MNELKQLRILIQRLNASLMTEDATSPEAATMRSDLAALRDRETALMEELDIDED